LGATVCRKAYSLSAPEGVPDGRPARRSRGKIRREDHQGHEDHEGAQTGPPADPASPLRGLRVLGDLRVQRSRYAPSN